MHKRPLSTMWSPPPMSKLLIAVFSYPCLIKFRRISKSISQSGTTTLPPPMYKNDMVSQKIYLLTWTNIQKMKKNIYYNAIVPNTMRCLPSCGDSAARPPSFFCGSMASARPLNKQGDKFATCFFLVIVTLLVIRES